MLLLQRRGFRPLELLIVGFVGIIGLSYLVELLIAPPDWGRVLHHAIVPGLAGPASVTLAVGVIGATVMPHALYLHSSLMPDRLLARNDAERRALIAYSNREVVVALGVAGLINMAMMTMAAVMFHPGHADVASIETAYATLVPLMGIGAAGVFMLSLLASGFSSSVVATLAGQGIMQDFVPFRIPLWLRRAATMLPAIAVIAMGVDTTRALVLSQVVLSLILPVPMVALLLLTGDRAVMGSFAISRPVRLLATAAAVLVLGLNALLVLQTLGIEVPYLG